MSTRSLGDVARQHGLTRTVYAKNFSGGRLFGSFDPSVHVEAWTPRENETHRARYGFVYSDGVGSVLGERFSFPSLWEVANAAANPLGLDREVLPYTPTDEDAQDCKLVVGLWELVEMFYGQLHPPAPVTPPAPPTSPTEPTTPTPPADPSGPKLSALRALLTDSLAKAEKDFPASAKGLPAKRFRDLAAAVRSGLKNSA